jgi:hypothetical protein
VRNLRAFLRYIGRYAYRTQIDWSLKTGEFVVSDAWPDPMEIIDINWVIWAAALRVGPDPDAIVVEPLWSLRRA